MLHEAPKSMAIPPPPPPPPTPDGYPFTALGRGGAYLTGTNYLTKRPEPARTNRPATTPPRPFKRDAILQTGIELLTRTPRRTHF